MKICLAGFMGCGKSTVGRKLAEVLCCTFADLDCAVEEMCGMDIPAVFALYGETYFREKEAEALNRLLTSDGDMVIALGGGTVTVPGCRREINSHAVCIYLRSSVETLVKNLSGATGQAGFNPDGSPAAEAVKRPLLKNCRNRAELTTRIEEMLAARKEIYEAVSDIIADTDGKSADDLAREIAACSLLPAKRIR